MKRYKFLILLTGLSFFLSSCLQLARTINFLPAKKITELEFIADKSNSNFEFYYSDTTGNKYLRDLRNDYLLDSLVEGVEDDFESVKIILDWTSKQWNHSVSNQPDKSDAISILEEVKEGKTFRCVEFGIVSTAALNSINLPARVLGLKTRDVEKVKFAAGHVAAEVYLSDYSKWVFIDAQMNIMPVLNNIPLNAVEFQSAILNNRDDLTLVNINGTLSNEEKEKYVDFVAKYLFYFDINFDNRICYNFEKKRINEQYQLTLVPVNADNPDVFQRKYPINSEYTNSVADFYKSPFQ